MLPAIPRPLALTAVFLVAALPSWPRCAAATDWPQWRGPDRAGVWVDVRLPSKLEEKVVAKRWEKEIGGGYAGIAVAGGRVYTLDRPRRPGGESGAEAPADAERVLCFDAATGERVWAHEYAAAYGDMDHANGPRATPTVAGGHVYAFGALGHLQALDARSGGVVWSLDTVRKLQAKLPIWGQAASPLIHEDLLIVQAAARPGGTVVALDRESGTERWRALDDRPGYSSPVIRDVGGKPELLVWTADAVAGLSPKTGEVRWRFPFATSNYDVAIISPVLQDGLLFVSGYWDGACVLGLREGSRPEPLWKAKLPSCLMATPLVSGAHLYVLDKDDGLLCLEWKTGKVVWKDGHRMTSKDRNPHASMVWAGGDRAAILNAEGDLLLARLSPSGYEELGRVPIIGRTWAHPAFSGQDVFARSDHKLVCVRLAAPAGAGDAPRRSQDED